MYNIFITVGCWVETVFGEAVVTDIHQDYIGNGEYAPRQPWVDFRYLGVRLSDEQEMWIADGDVIGSIIYLRPKDELATKVLEQHKCNEPYLVLEDVVFL